MATQIDIGRQLREARESQGMSLRDVAEATKIALRHLDAIEHDAFETLPPGIFRREFMRAFAVAVGLDGAELVREYVARFDPPRPAPPPQPDTPLRPAAILLTLGLVGALFAVGILVTRETEVRAGDQPAGERDAGSTAATVAAGPATANAATSSRRDAGMRVRLEARGPCWVGATADGRRVAYRTLAAGETLIIEAEHEIVLRVGEPAAVSCSLDGKALAPLGAPGQPTTVRFVPGGPPPAVRRAGAA